MNGDETAKLLVLISPSTGIGTMFTELAGLMHDQRDGLDPARVAVTCSHYGIAFAGP